MEQIHLRVAGKPATKQRPRWNPIQKRMVNPPANIVSENDIRAVWREAGEPRFEGRVPLRLQIWVHVMRPQSHFRKDGGLTLEGTRVARPVTKKPDVDNAAKCVMDALNGRAYQDDVQVVELIVRREWAEWPQTVIHMESL